MPTVPEYQSQVGLPKQSGLQPVSPGVFDLGYTASSLGNLSNQLASAAAIQAYRENQQEALDQTTAATLELLNLQKKVETYQGELRSEIQNSSVPADPREFKKRHVTHIENLMNDTVAAAADKGNIYQKYIATHGTVYTMKANQEFIKEMDGLWNEKHTFDLDIAIEGNIQGAISDPTDPTGDTHLSKIFALTQAQVKENFWKADKALNVFKQARHRLKFGKGESIVMSNANAWWDARRTGTVPDAVKPFIIEPEDLVKWDESANRTLQAEQSRASRQHDEATRAAQFTDEETGKNISNMIDQNVMNTPTDLEPYKSNLKRDTYETYKRLLREKERGEHVVSDPMAVEWITSQIYSFDEGGPRGLQPSAIADLVEKRRLNVKDANHYIMKRNEIIKAHEESGQQQYDKEAQEAESILNTLMGPVDYTKDNANERARRGQAIHELRSMWWQHRKESVTGRRYERGTKPGAAEPLFPTHPTDWVYDIYTRYIAPYRQGLALEAKKLQESLPVLQQKPDSAYQQYQQGRITYGQWRQSVIIDKMVQQSQSTLEQNESMLQEYKRGAK